MKTNTTIYVRAFAVKVHDRLTDEITQDTVVLTKEQLQAAQLVGQSSKELIARICGRAGYDVVEIGKAEKREMLLNLEELYRFHTMALRGKREKVEV